MEWHCVSAPVYCAAFEWMHLIFLHDNLVQMYVTHPNVAHLHTLVLYGYYEFEPYANKVIMITIIKKIEKYNNGINPQGCANVNCVFWVLSLRNVHGHQEQVREQVTRLLSRLKMSTR